MSCESCGAVKDATTRIQKDKRSHELKKISIICLAVVFSIALVCATVLGVYAIREQQETIREQQYALNMQYASLMEYVAGAEITTETITQEADAGDGGTAVAGDGNTVAGGDLNG